MAIGDRFRTGEICPVTGIYENVHYHPEREPKPDDVYEYKYIPIKKGETFPPCRKCSSPVIWILRDYPSLPKLPKGYV